MRKHYLDNLRTIMILLLFSVHTFMIWNNYGSKFYVWGGESELLSSLIVLFNPWFMAILFVIAGMCALPYCFTSITTYPSISLYIILPTYILLGIYSFHIMKRES